MGQDEPWEAALHHGVAWPLGQTVVSSGLALPLRGFWVLSEFPPMKGLQD